MTAYRFCRSDDIGLLVEAYVRCRGPEDEGEPVLDREGFKRLIRDLDLWCSSCMVASEGREPVGVLLGAKRPEATLVYALRVHPAHRRRGHGRHLLTSLSQKLAILGPPNLVAEVPAGRAAAEATFAACGWQRSVSLTDWNRGAPVTGSATNEAREALEPVWVEDLASAGLLTACCWHRDAAALLKQSERLSGLAFHSPDRIEAWALWDAEGTLWALGATPGPFGRPGLSVVLDEIGTPLHLEKAAPGEVDAELLTALGFVRGAEHLLFTSQAQAA